MTPFLSIALAHFEAAALRSSFGAVTMNSVSGPARSASSIIASAPARPGFPVGSRSSMMRCSANSDRLPLDAVSCRPVEAGRRDVQFARTEAALARRFANGVQRLRDQQMFVARNQVAGCEGLLEV